MTDLEQRQEPRSRGAGRRTQVVGLLADPDTPAEIAAKLVDTLPGVLAAQVDDEVTWDVRTMTHPVTASVQDPEEVLGAVADQTAHTEWDIGIYLTDLPMQHDEQPILADVDHDRRVAGLSLPGFGPFLQHHKVRNAIVRLVADLAGVGDAGLEHGRHHPIRLGRAAARFLQPVRVLRAGRGRHTRRYVTTPRRGRVRLLAGMVRTNEPWRLVLGHAHRAGRRPGHQRLPDPHLHHDLAARHPPRRSASSS